MALRTNWQGILRISQEENAGYDGENEGDVRSHLQDNQDKVTTFQHLDLNRLQGAEYIDTLFTHTEIRATIKSFKNSTPGH